MNHNRLAIWLGYARKYPNTVVAMLFLLVLFVCFQPLFLGHATIKWDAFRLWLPWKHFIVEELLNGQLPLWNPFMNHGFPQHGDTMTWYPVSWIIGFFYGSYNLSALNTEYLLHLFIAGFGFYTFSGRFNPSKRLRFFLGLSYMLSGLMIGNAQHMAWIISAAWLPWYFLTLSALLEKGTLIHLLRFALVGFLLFSGGYLAMFFVVVYCSVAYVSWKIYRHPNMKRRWGSLGLMGLSIGIIVVLSAPLLYSVYEIFPLFNRFDPETAIDINLGGTPLIGVLAIILPFASGMFNVPEFDFGTFSAFFGSAPFLLVIYFLVRRAASKKALALLSIALFFLLLSLSDVIPFRDWISHLPLLNLFRYPSLFRLFFVFFALWGLGELMRQQSLSMQSLKRSAPWLIGTLFCFVGSVFCFWQSDEVVFGEALQRFFGGQHRYPVDVWFRCGINALFLAFFGLMGYVILQFKRPQFLATLVLAFWGVEMLLVAHLAGPHVLYEPVNVAQANTLLHLQPKQTPAILEHHQALENNQWKGYADFGWGGKTNFIKQFSGLWFNPLSLQNPDGDSKIAIPESYPLYGIVNDSGKYLDVPLKLTIHNNQHWSIDLLEQLVEDDCYVYIQQRFVPNWLAATGEKLQSTQEGFILIPLQRTTQSIDLRYQSAHYWWYFLLFSIVFAGVVVTLIVCSPYRWRYALALVIIALVSTYHVQQRTSTLEDSNEYPVLQEKDGVELSLATFWENLPNTIAIPADYTLSDRFIHTIHYAYPEVHGRTHRSNGDRFVVLNAAKKPRKTLFEVDLNPFIANGYTTDLTALLKQRTWRHRAPYLVLTYRAHPETTAKIWVVNSQNGTWVNGIAFDLATNGAVTETKRLIHRIDLSRFQPQHNETVKLFIWGEGDISDVEVLTLEMRE